MQEHRDVYKRQPRYLLFFKAATSTRLPLGGLSCWPPTDIALQPSKTAPSGSSPGPVSYTHLDVYKRQSINLTNTKMEPHQSSRILLPVGASGVLTLPSTIINTVKCVVFNNTILN